MSSLTYIKKDQADLAYRYANEDSDFKIGEIFVPDRRADLEFLYRTDAINDWFKRTSGLLRRDGYPEQINRSDSTTSASLSPRGLSRLLELAKIKNPMAHGYATPDAWMDDEWMFLRHRTLINREAAGVEVIEADGSYNSDQLYEIGGADPQDADLISTVPWSNLLSKPRSDVNVIKKNNRHLTHMACGRDVYCDLLLNPQLLDASESSAPIKESTDPNITLPWLERTLGLKIILLEAESVDDSSLPQASQTKTDIFGYKTSISKRYVWFGRVDPNAGGGRQSIPTWGKEFVYEPAESVGGFIALEKVDQYAWLMGTVELIMGYFNAYEVYGKAYGARLDGV